MTTPSHVYPAYVESRRLGAPAAGSEHLLLGIVTTAPGPATIFAGTRVTPAEVERLIAIVGPALPERPVRWSQVGHGCWKWPFGSAWPSEIALPKSNNRVGRHERGC